MMNQHADYLTLRGVSKTFGSFTALRDIELNIKKGEFVCFLGPSGCGKTTLLRIIAGLETQDDGRIVQDGRDVSWLAPIKRDYGIVFQSYALFPNLSVGANVAYGLVNRRMGKAALAARVRELLTLAGLPDSADKYPAQLSGGQQQRIALARALATSPGLLLLDEPLSALDALERVRLRGEIRQLQQRLGVTTIMVTHDQEEALAMADRIVVMNHGVIEQIGTPQQVYLQPRSPFVAAFIGKANVLRGTALGAGRFSCGALKFSCAPELAALPAGHPVSIYLRPEDLVACDSEHGNGHHAMAEVRKIEFLGAFSFLTVALDGMEEQPIVLSMSLNKLREHGLEVGSRSRFGLLPERLRVFADRAAAGAP
ncbi:putative 2-aminoethylphosphonate ABC transporter ATP-binding protein, partial [Janthinobacterium sp.]|uniref:putative 2-aminoethylphosphonate ABC transporter ATP-binding protein n=1 Tax=Janthinobacterium sp. TaxID=1871054 RepID=UPI00397796C2